LGLKVKNTPGLHLLQGLVTVFEGGTYAGDARIMDLQPNEGRLLSYAVDLGTEVKPEAAAGSGRLTHVKAVKGVLHTTTKLRETKAYTVKDRNPQGRAALIGHPVKDQFRLVGTTMLVQTARDVYRFELKVPAGRPGPAAAGVGLGVRSAAPDKATRPSPPCAHGASRGPISAAEPRRSVGCDRRRPRRGGLWRRYGGKSLQPFFRVGSLRCWNRSCGPGGRASGKGRLSERGASAPCLLFPADAPWRVCRPERRVPA
jgi:hypothetical protein